MANPASRAERISLARKRLVRVLGALDVATMRTLEQKISDAGPTNQRVDPHLLTMARIELTDEGVIASRPGGSTTWYHLATAEPATVLHRLQTLLPLHSAISTQDFAIRLGQALEIAIYRALTAVCPLPFFGAFLDLHAHDDSRAYRKEEPPSVISGRALPARSRFDFVLTHPTAAAAGLEAKNIREWFYPDREEVKELLSKCVRVNAVPVLIARRIHYSTFSVLHHCGLIMHQTFGQVYPASAEAIARQAADKTLLGYHDVRIGNEPDARLLRFVGRHLPSLLPSARAAFAAHQDLLEAFAIGGMPYREFAGRVKRRSRGEPEDLPPFEDEDAS